MDHIADAWHALSHPLLSPAVLLHQAQQHCTAGLTRAFLLVLIHPIQTDLELGIGPVSGWKSPEGGGSRHGEGGDRKNKRKGKNFDPPEESILPAQLHLVSSLLKPVSLTRW